MIPSDRKALQVVIAVQKKLAVFVHDRSVMDAAARLFSMGGGYDSDQMFRRFLERISDCAMFVLDPLGRVRSWNDGARAIIGYTAEAIVGQPFAIFHKADAPEAPGHTLAVAGALGRFETEDWLVRDDGRCFFAAITVTAIVDDAGAMTGFGAMIRDLTERLKAEEQKASVMALLEKTAGTDFLTGVANRRALDATLITMMASAKRHGRPLSVAMLDLDHFKAFNDSRGHRAGDLYLQDAIQAWRGVPRGDSLLARYGGEEFTIIMPDTTACQALDAMQRVRAATPAPNTCSIGIAQWDTNETADEVLHRADRGLYRAKDLGRDRVEFGPESRSTSPDAGPAPAWLRASA